MTESLDSSSDINQIHWTAFLAELNKAPIRKQLNLTWPGFTRCPTKQDDKENRWAIARKADGMIPESLLWPNTSPVGRLRSWNITFLGLAWPDDDALWKNLRIAEKIVQLTSDKGTNINTAVALLEKERDARLTAPEWERQPAMCNCWANLARVPG